MMFPIAFQFEGNDVRTMRIMGAIWFVLVDVCKVLEIRNPSDAVKRLDDDEKATLDNTEGQAGKGAQEYRIINESGLYSLVLTSRKAAAKRFKKWVTAEVLPTLRATGRYEMPGGLNDDGLQVNPSIARLPVSERNYALGVVREARKTYGERGARVAWEQSGILPDLSSVIDEEAASEQQRFRADLCLWRVLRHKFCKTLTVADMVTAAQYREDARDALEAKGILVSQIRHPGHVVISINHPFINEIYAVTEWAGIFARVLQEGVPRARRTKRPLQFGDHNSHGVIIPLTAVQRACGY
ncbi:BRO-N domain-containing protein [Thalassospira xiamenensis]|uniref:BRO-N domain-containing protein n=1 Tax=Thalassospira xiamenensis TaxID=220697 RepID=UPI000DED8BFF|nr:BRO family protein [Thalassospira xiamenensis]